MPKLFSINLSSTNFCDGIYHHKSHEPSGVFLFELASFLSGLLQVHDVMSRLHIIDIAYPVQLLVLGKWIGRTTEHIDVLILRLA